MTKPSIALACLLLACGGQSERELTRYEPYPLGCTLFVAAPGVCMYVPDYHSPEVCEDEWILGGGQEYGDSLIADGPVELVCTTCDASSGRGDPRPESECNP